MFYLLNQTAMESVVPPFWCSLFWTGWPLFFQHGQWGGMSHISHRKCATNTITSQQNHICIFTMDQCESSLIPCLSGKHCFQKPTSSSMMDFLQTMRSEIVSTFQSFRAPCQTVGITISSILDGVVKSWSKVRQFLKAMLIKHFLHKGNAV